MEMTAEPKPRRAKRLTFGEAFYAVFEDQKPDGMSAVFAQTCLLNISGHNRSDPLGDRYYELKSGKSGLKGEQMKDALRRLRVAFEKRLERELLGLDI